MNITPEDQWMRHRELERYAEGDRTAEPPATGGYPAGRQARTFLDATPGRFWLQSDRRSPKGVIRSWRDKWPTDTK